MSGLGIQLLPRCGFGVRIARSITDGTVTTQGQVECGLQGTTQRQFPGGGPCIGCRNRAHSEPARSCNVQRYLVWRRARGSLAGDLTNDWGPPLTSMIRLSAHTRLEVSRPFQKEVLEIHLELSL